MAGIFLLLRWASRGDSQKVHGYLHWICLTWTFFTLSLSLSLNCEANEKKVSRMKVGKYLRIFKYSSDPNFLRHFLKRCMLIALLSMLFKHKSFSTVLLFFAVIYRWLIFINQKLSGEKKLLVRVYWVRKWIEYEQIYMDWYYHVNS